ncbi:MAG: ArgR family transcriptional regulator [Prevotella sp.]|nr:ArgR family transcriptional regulator [Prevotella sp.]
MSKKDRHAAIREIIATQEVETQGRLLKLLADKGFLLTQATLSRDMKELKIGRIPADSGGYVYRLSQEPAGKQFSASRGLSGYGFLGIEFSGNLAVLKTRPGYAMSIAAEIDGQMPKEIIGTIAGDDTVLLVIGENIDREEVKRALNRLIHGGK